MVPDRLHHFSDPVPVLSDGHVILLDVMGDDLAIVDAARVSFRDEAKNFKDTENRHLVRYLMRHRHTTPFEMCEIKLRVRVPMDCWRQWIRHRSASVNEVSTRYRPAIDSMDRTSPEAWRAQSTDNKQGSNGFIATWPDDCIGRDGVINAPYAPISPGIDIGWYLSQREERAQDFAREVYEERLALGVAKEQARKDLPLSTFTEAVWKIDLHNLLHFLSLRMDPHAQLEIRLYAEAISRIVKAWVPWTWEAFEDYRLEAMSLTRNEKHGMVGLIKNLIQEHVRLSNELFRLKDNGVTVKEVGGFLDVVRTAQEASGLPAPKEGKTPPREWTEFETKLRHLLAD